MNSRTRDELVEFIDAIQELTKVLERTTHYELPVNKIHHIGNHLKESLKNDETITEIR